MLTYVALTPLYQYFSASCLLCLSLSVFVSHISHKQLEGGQQTSFTPIYPQHQAQSLVYSDRKRLCIHYSICPETFPYLPPVHSPLNLVYYWRRGEHWSPCFSCIRSWGTPILTFVDFCPILTRSFILGQGVPFDWSFREGIDNTQFSP